MRVAVDVTPIFAACFARNRGPVPGDPDAKQLPNYGVSARLDGAVIELTLTFRAGSAYCCYEPGCHLSYTEDAWWHGLRVDLLARGFEMPSRLVLRLTVIVEVGALFFDFRRPDRSRRGWYDSALAEAHRYHKEVAERGGPDAPGPAVG